MTAETERRTAAPNINITITIRGNSRGTLSRSREICCNAHRHLYLAPLVYCCNVMATLAHININVLFCEQAHQ